MPCEIRRKVEGENGFSHSWTGGYYYQVGSAETCYNMVEVSKARFRAHIKLLVGTGFPAQLVVGLKDYLVDLYQTVNRFALAYIVNFLFGKVKKLLRAFLSRGGGFDYLLCGGYQASGVVFLLDDLAVALNILCGGNTLHNGGKIFLARRGAFKDTVLDRFVYNGDDIRVYAQRKETYDYCKKIAVL